MVNILLSIYVISFQITQTVVNQMRCNKDGKTFEKPQSWPNCKKWSTKHEGSAELTPIHYWMRDQIQPKCKQCKNTCAVISSKSQPPTQRLLGGKLSLVGRRLWKRRQTSNKALSGTCLCQMFIKRSSSSGIGILSIENSLKFSHVESQPSIMREKVKIKL